MLATNGRDGREELYGDKCGWRAAGAMKGDMVCLYAFWTFDSKGPCGDAAIADSSWLLAERRNLKATMHPCISCRCH